MPMRIIFVVLVFITLAVPRAAHADALPPEDKQIINTLLERLKERKDLHFIRDKKVYDAQTAATYLRFKWSQNRDKVYTVEDFITLASVGGEHGEITYYVQFDDGREEPARTVLEASVKTLRGDGKAK